jgi:para-nitrobenzyl esterase
MLSSGYKAGAKVFACIFDQVPAGWRQEGCVSSHAIELPYVFGAVEIEQEWMNLNQFASPAGAKSNAPKISDVDTKVSEMMMKLWSQFARTGDPNVEGLIEWPVWEPSSDKYIYVKDNLQMKTGYSKVPG